MRDEIHSLQREMTSLKEVMRQADKERKRQDKCMAALISRAELDAAVSVLVRGFVKA